MTNRRTKLLVFAFAAIITLLAPAAASAQNWPGRGRDDDRYGRRSGRISDNERRLLREVARRIDDRSRSFQRNVDRALDNSRYDDTRREDRVNQEAADFRRAAERFRGRAGDSNDLSRSTTEARQLLSEAARVDRMLRRLRVDSRTQNDWSQIRSDLGTVADFYNLRIGDFDDDNDRGRDRDRRDDGRRRNDRWPF
jgi:hypothetical protein